MPRRRGFLTPSRRGRTSAVGPAGFERAIKGLCVPLRLSPPGGRPFVVWTVPSPWGKPGRCLRVQSLHLPIAGLGSALAWAWPPEAFADFTEVLRPDFSGRDPDQVPRSAVELWARQSQSILGQPAWRPGSHLAAWPLPSQPV